MKSWVLSHSKDGWSVVVYELPAWRIGIARFWEWLIPTWLCCGRWFYFTWLHNPLFLDDDRKGPNWHIPVSEEVAAQIQPKFYADVKSWDEEDED